MTHKQRWESRTHTMSLDNDPALLPLPSMAPTPHGAPGHSQDEVTPMGAGMDAAREQRDSRFGGSSCNNSRVNLKKIHFQAV